ncbi:hypothetical protein XA68_14426 [Ophiocordyceps unilateralis]|uniref:AAA+ ATPase domain-containing protein n=1 Tax=Ophiocordyceps unilateralis TaxID=268505 RepID=A0A2A9P8S5_OPHUN|nr:hypothetical protein XA68_14426 [Ophiocordyceps unilateralis]
MDSHDGPSEGRKEPACRLPPAQESTCVPSDTAQSIKKEMDSVHSSQKDNGKNKVTAAARKQTPSKKRHRKRSAITVSPGRDDDSSSTSQLDDDDVLSDSESDSVFAAADSDSDVPKKKQPLRSSKNQQLPHKAKGKRKSIRSGHARRRTRDSSDSDSDSSDSIFSTDAVVGDGRSIDGRFDARESVRADFHDQLYRLELCVSQLQFQMSQNMAMAPAGHVYDMASTVPNTMGLSAGHCGNTMSPAGSGNCHTQSSAPLPGAGGFSARMGQGPRMGKPPLGFRDRSSAPRLSMQEVTNDRGSKKPQGMEKKTTQKGSKADFKRVDWVWDSSLYTYKLQDTAEMSLNSLYDEYIFHVRRTFDCEGKYRATFVDIRSKLLRECLEDVIGNVRGASLVDETPKLDPNLLFLYLEDFRLHVKHLRKMRPSGGDKKERTKIRARLRDKRKQLKVLIRYLDEDYAKIKDSLYPMLDSGVITFDLLWALWKPNTLIYGITYGSVEDPRVFKVDMAYHQSSIMRGNFYVIEGKYLEFDGKKFGYGTSAEDIPEFQGARKITSLPCYPLQYHKDETRVRQNLIERGKKFVALSGVHYKCYSGVAYMKRKKGSIIKFNVQQSRVMVDAAIFRRMNPNYAVSMVRPKDHDVLSDDGMSDDFCESDSPDERRAKLRYVSKMFKGDKGDALLAKLPKSETGDATKGRVLESLPREAADKVPSDGFTNGGVAAEREPSDSSMNGGEAAETPVETPAEVLPQFSDENYLIASPVVFGFSFSEKQWLELSVSAVKDISWNEKAWDSLVLEPETKDLIQALVQSRKYHAAQTIDDVIQGKGKGLVTVLHGPPGTGKTLTAEGISELLKCPLYMASAGELGTDSRYLETELQKILDICHAWGAILLLDEADVFLEKRNMQDIHRNALVSIFLRQLEYFQGILFLTTNRVETFDEAFQSRIHIALRYDSLDTQAKKTIFSMFIDRIKALGKLELQPFTEEDLDDLARHDLNGREIKNVVGSAQDLAVSKGEVFSMRHMRKVLDVHAKFGRDLRGGPGYEEAMRSYF